MDVAGVRVGDDERVVKRVRRIEFRALAPGGDPGERERFDTS